MGWILSVIVLQTIIAGVVIFVLKRLLDRELIDAALEKLQAATITPESAPVFVKSAGLLKPQAQAAVKALVERKAKGIAIHFEQDSDLKGGILIEFKNGKIDCSLASRLQNLKS